MVTYADKKHLSFCYATIMETQRLSTLGNVSSHSMNVCNSLITLLHTKTLGKTLILTQIPLELKRDNA